MKIIATTPAENKILTELSEHLRSKGIFPSLINYKDGFGATVWSVYDLDSIPAARNWSYEERLRFMEKYGAKIGGATEDAWVRISTYVDEHLENKIKKGNAMNNPTAQAINGEIRRGDKVIAAGNNDYAYLAGEVIEILKHGTPEHAAATDNETDSVHVNFFAFKYPPWQQIDIAEHFNAFSDSKKYIFYENLPLGNVIMAPDMLIRITDLSDEKINEFVCDYEEAQSFCDNITGDSENEDDAE